MGYVDTEFAVDVFCGVTVSCVCEVVGRTLEDDISAAATGFGSDVDKEVGCANNFFVVLDNDDGVAFVSKASQNADKPGSVARVQTDAWLVEDVDGALESSSESCCEVYALTFATGESRGESVESEVSEPDFEQVFYAVTNFDEEAMSDGLFGVGEVEVVEPLL